jgi:glycosyltransferase involved in cell wall biosynthesis
MQQDKKVGVVVPAYNEERFIEEVIKTMPTYVDRIFVVNDKSSDRTGEILSKMNNDRLVVVTHQQRMGAGGAMISGYKKALSGDMDIITIMAGDGQMDPTILDKIIEPVLSGKADYSKGNRLSLPEHRNGMPKFRLLGNFLLTFMVKLASGYWNIDDPMNGYTAISGNTLAKIDLDKVQKGYAFEADLMVKLNVVNAIMVNVPMPSRYRGEKSKIKYWTFIMRLSLVLARSFVWRLWVKYIKKSRHS